MFALQTFLWESVIKTLPEIASKFFFTSSRCELPYQLPLLISLRSGIKSQSIVETIFLTFYRSKYDKRPCKIFCFHPAFLKINCVYPEIHRTFRANPASGTAPIRRRRIGKSIISLPPLFNRLCFI